MTDQQGRQKAGSALGGSIFQDLSLLTGAGTGGTATLTDGRSLRVVPVADLRPDPKQVRALGTLAELQAAEDQGDLIAARELERLRAMAASIAEIGLQEPLGVEELSGGKYRVVHGHRRLLALQLANRTEAPVVVWARLPQSVRVRAQLVENLERQDLGEIELYEGMVAYRTALAAERQSEVERIAWGDVAQTFGMSDTNRQRLARLTRLCAAAYALAKRARLSEFVLRPLLQYLYQTSGDAEHGLSDEAQLRIVQAVVQEEQPSSTLVVALLQKEVGPTERPDLPAGRSLSGVQFERRWIGLGKEVKRVQEGWTDLTTADQEAVGAAMRQASAELETALRALAES